MSISIQDKTIVDDVFKFPEIEWDWDQISWNEHVTEEFVFRCADKLNFENLSSNKAIRIEFILEHKCDFNWNLKEVASNPNLNEKNIFQVFTKEQISTYANLLSGNAGIGVDFLFNTMYLGWDMESICYREDLTENHLMSNPHLDWHWDIVSYAPGIDKTFLMNHPKLDRKAFFKYNKNLTIDEVAHLHPREIESNPLNGTVKDKVDFAIRYRAAKKIESMLYQAYWFVDFEFCRKRLNKRYDELFGIA
jgi:hypothetical protein